MRTARQVLYARFYFSEDGGFEMNGIRYLGRRTSELGENRAIRAHPSEQRGQNHPYTPEMSQSPSLEKFDRNP